MLELFQEETWPSRVTAVKMQRMLTAGSYGVDYSYRHEDEMLSRVSNQIKPPRAACTDSCARTPPPPTPSTTITTTTAATIKPAPAALQPRLHKRRCK